jgi:glycosyltransferase 2 family protein
VARRIQGNLGAAVGAARAIAPRHALVWLGLALSALFLWLALRDVDFADTRRALAKADWWVIPPAVVVLAFGVYLRILRWRALFVPETRPPFGATARALLAGLLLNVMLPLRAGEAARVLMISRETGNSRSEVLATAVVERVFDVLALLVLLLAAAPFLPRVSWLATAAVVAAVLVAALAALVFVLVRHDERPVRFVLRRLPLVSDARADAAAANLVRGFASIRRPRMAVTALALTLASWLVIAGCTAILLLGFDYGLGFGAALLVVVATNLALVLPSSPAAVGQYEWAVQVALATFGVDSSRALSAALLLHAVNVFPFVVAGYAALHAHARRGGRREVRKAGGPEHEERRQARPEEARMDGRVEVEAVEDRIRQRPRS